MAIQTLQMIGTGLSVYSAIQEGQAKKQEAAFNRKQFELQAKQEEIAGRDAINNRLRDFDRATANNLAFYAFLGRDVASDRSLRAFFEAERDIALEDVKAIDRDVKAKASQSRTQGRMGTARGRSAGASSLIRATSSVVSGIQRYDEYKLGGEED